MEKITVRTDPKMESRRGSETSITARTPLSASLPLAGPLWPPIGSQTYPHRQRISDGDFGGLCRDMAAIGIRDVEMCDPISYPEFGILRDGKQVRKILDDHGLNCPSGHFGLDALRTSQQELIAWAQEIGMTQIGTASLRGEMRNGIVTMDAVKRAADEYNRIAVDTSAAGLQQFLHDEDFEIAKVEGDGRLAYTVLLDLLDSELVKMQFQISAMTVVGDPIEYFRGYPGRFISMHLQGVDLNDQTRAWRVAVGQDSLDWPGIFQAAKIGGLKNYFVELNWDLTKESVAYLRTINL